jgi:hypothetical protein
VNNDTSNTPESSRTEVFANCTDLRNKYPNGVLSTHPSYQTKLDREK